MGRPFKEELSNLSETYAWAMQQDVTPLAVFLRANVDDAVCFIGSGGSFSAANFAAYLHECFTTQIAQAVTPLQFSARSGFQPGGVMMMSAAGKNRDILASMRHAIERDTKQLAIACFAPDSPLVNTSLKIWAAETFSSANPTGQDGFLATNSLLAFFILTARAYQDAGLTARELPKTISALRKTAVWSKKDITKAMARQNVIILFGPHSRPAAIDLESKLSEAALAAPQLVDFRNFAHGRHHWIAKRSAETGLIAFVSPDVKDLAERTLQSVGNRIPVARVGLPDAPLHSNTAALLAVFEATRIAGELRGIDPGRPGVPEFGRKIYNLRFTSPTRSAIGGNPTLELVTRRKFGALTAASPSIRRQGYRAAQEFVASLCRPVYGGVIFDYDGTLCSHRERFTPLRDEIAGTLSRLLKNDIIVGIASGRGKSVRKQLQQSLDSGLWDRVWIGYYNGSQVSTLSDNGTPRVDVVFDSSIERLNESLRNDVVISAMVHVTTRPNQITLQTKSPILPTDRLWRYASQIVQRFDNLRVLFSTHSVDIVPIAVTKLSVVGKLRQLLTAGREVLCIGDLGQFPGNDFDLLRHPYSLSSDEVSTDEKSCWNLAPACFRGMQATQYYLRHLKLARGAFRLTLPQLRS